MSLQENILKKIFKIFFLIIFLIIADKQLLAKEKWLIDKNLSYIKFEVPVLLARNVKGEFKNIEGFVELDIENNLDNKALFSVDIKSLEINYKKYLDLILSDIFFDVNQHPISVLDTKKFKYKNEEEIILDFELTIKGISRTIPFNLKIISYSDDFVQVYAITDFSRISYNIGTGNWSNTTILKDKIKLESNIFLVRE